MPNVEPAGDQEIRPPKVEGSDSSTKISSIDKEKILTFVEDLIDTLTLKRVLLIALLTIIALVLFSLFENRIQIVDHFTQPKAEVSKEVGAWILSDASKAALKQLSNSTAISFVAVTDVDLKKNRKVVKFYYIDDPQIKSTPAEEQAFSLPQAVFDYDAKNTAQMVAILGNEFKCDAYKDTVYNRYAPEIAEKVPTICRIAIPPFVGQFVGFITVGIGQKMTKQELDSIRLEISRIAVEIYLSDVTKKPVP